MKRSRRRPVSRPAGSRRIRRWIIPFIGALTPVGLIGINIAVFIVHNLSVFRWTITVLAFVSGMMLNSYFGLKIYRLFKRHFQSHPLSAERNQDVVLIGGMALVIAISFGTAVACYLGLSDERKLPNALTFLAGAVAILVPIAAQAVLQRLLGEPPPDTEHPMTALPAPTYVPPPPPPRPIENFMERRP